LGDRGGACRRFGRAADSPVQHDAAAEEYACHHRDDRDSRRAAADLHLRRVALRRAVVPASHEIVAEPFLIVGILAGIKEIVVLSVEAATLLDKGPDFSRAVVEIGVLGGVVLVLALAAFVLRERRRDTADAGEVAAQEQGPGSG
jgi:hypothetical protein